ncbi:hypothetical protein TB2_002438 [Malus domestica]
MEKSFMRAVFEKKTFLPLDVRFPRATSSSKKHVKSVSSMEKSFVCAVFEKKNFLPLGVRFPRTTSSSKKHVKSVSSMEESFVHAVSEKKNFLHLGVRFPSATSSSKKRVFRTAELLTFTFRRRRLTNACSISKNRGKKKVIMVSGPTSSEKTCLALELDKRLNGKIISADSVQVHDVMTVPLTLAAARKDVVSDEGTTTGAHHLGRTRSTWTC